MGKKPKNRNRRNFLYFSPNQNGLSSSSCVESPLTNTHSSPIPSTSVERLNGDYIPSNFSGAETADEGGGSVPLVAKMTGNGPNMRKFNISQSYSGSKKDNIRLVHKTWPSIGQFVEDLVPENGIRRPIEKLLISTNGIAAVKCILSNRKWLQHIFGDDKKIKFICMTTLQEIDSNPEYLKLADHYVVAPAGDNKNNYANVDEIVSHAVEENVDAVWAGWGHASENPELPKQLAARGISFLGPPCNAMFSLGDKIASTIIAQTLDIPTIAWSGSGLKLDLTKQKTGHLTVHQELFDMACVKDLNEGLRALEVHKIGYPLMIKASEGGGGKGIRKCKNETDFRGNFMHVQTEVPGSPIFIMKCVENARHIEVQLIADKYGTVIPVYTRDCSIQRRCQKIIEEAPASIAPPEVLRSMQEDAVKIAKLVGYESAGTVEYMYLPEDNTYFFLELNPRLQVEHPCTEMIANINIPAIQMQIAMGLPLERIADIRLFYGFRDHELFENTPLPKDLVRTNVNSHCIAARITSEDPEDFFRPSTGQIEHLNFHSAKDVWGYFSVSSSGKVHEFADSQFGHLFALGRNRQEAIASMLVALNELEIRSTCQSQVSYLVDMLKEPDFTENRFNTQWLDNRIANRVAQRPPLPRHELIALSSAIIGHYKIAFAFNSFRNAVERGQILPTKDLTETILFDLVKDMNIYKVTVTRSGPINYFISLNGGKTKVEIRILGDGGLLVTYNERSHVCNLEETNDKYKVSIGRSLVIFEKDNDPTILKSPYTGKLLGYKKPHGEFVPKGAIYASVESMKLVFDVEVKKAPGRLEHVAKEGDLLYPGSVIARLVDVKDSEKYRPKPFLEKFEEWAAINETKNVSELKRYTICYEACQNILNGSIPPDGEFNPEELISELFDLLESPTLPHALLKNVLSPALKRAKDSGIIQKLEAAAEIDDMSKFAKIQIALEEYFVYKNNHNEYEAAFAIFSPVQQICEQYTKGTYATSVLANLLDRYYKCESYFEGRVYDDAVALMIEDLGSNKDLVVQMIYSHTQLKGKNRLVMTLLKALETRGMHMVTYLSEVLRDIGNMLHTDDVSEQCRRLQQRNNTPKYRKFLNQMIWDLTNVSIANREAADVLTVSVAVEQVRCLFTEMSKNGLSPSKVLEKSPWIPKVLHEFFFDEELSEFAINAFLARQFAVGSAQSYSIPLTIGKELTSADILVFFPVNDSNIYVSIVKLNVTPENLSSAVLDRVMVDGIASKYIEKGIKSNGIVSELRVYFLVHTNVACDSSDDSHDRKVQLEELPKRSKLEYDYVAEADKLSSTVQAAIAERLKTLDVRAQVIICQQHKPLMQVEALYAEDLELWRIPTGAHVDSERGSNVQVYRIDDENEKRFARLFARENVVIPLEIDDYGEIDVHQFELIENLVSEHLDSACGGLYVTMRKNRRTLFVANHVFMHVNVSRPLNQDQADAIVETLQDAIRLKQSTLYKHHVTEVEIVFDVNAESKYRLKFYDETGVTPEFGVYLQNKRSLKPIRLSHQLYGSQLTCYGPIKKIEKKRVSTRTNGTTYVYDYPTLFGRACLDEWKDFQRKAELSEFAKSFYNRKLSRLTSLQRQALDNGDFREFITVEELIVVDGKLRHISDPDELKRRADNCNNETGMVAWILTLYTPEKPSGLKLVSIANDITFQSGSFAIGEDELYSLASKYSRQMKIPRFNVSCNSGARIGLAEEISRTFRAKFRDPENLDEGFEYLYLDGSEEDAIKNQIAYERLPNGVLRIKAVIGRQNENIGVENLQGSGLIAGETSASYNDVPTYCFVTGRSVGIGAYTARLAHRVVQHKSSHMILTGAPALNTLLGKEVYTSNNQLGGIQIMHKNGVSHGVVDDDYEGIRKIVHWLSYLPEETAEFPYFGTFNLGEEKRSVTFTTEPNKPHDMRDLIDAKNLPGATGICDLGSFSEIMEEWAKTIIAGRARIGGIPIGVISSELRNVKNITPADPAAPNSQSVEIHQAGQVWYPDSAYKTAEVINDFNREGLPLLFIASLRGFSGGQKDMYDMVLKFGAQIVDALRAYRMPVIIYIPANGELRGGAWVVLDSQINPGFINMVADKESRGGILEPNAIVGIKFRQEKMMDLMKRNDETMQMLFKDQTEEIKKNGANSPEAERLGNLMKKRAKELEKPYRAIATEFADLHDRADRMIGTGAVQHVTDLTHSRNLFFDIFRVEIAKIKLSERYLDASSSGTPNEAYTFIRNELEEFRPGCTSLSPGEQFDVVKAFAEQKFPEIERKTRQKFHCSGLHRLSNDGLVQVMERCASLMNDVEDEKSVVSITKSLLSKVGNEERRKSLIDEMQRALRELSRCSSV